MKRILLAVAVLALVFPALRQAEARTDISIDFFYDNIGDGGNWIEAGEYGYCWQPNVAVSNRSWRPYSDGYWAYTDVGWTWVSYEDFGWATYHYGRWVRLKGRGWIWAPGREWGPAWVSWRTGGDYVGWAPLPPRRGGDIYVDFSPITARVDIDFDIGPAYYNFIDVRYIGEPVLRERIFAADQNVTYVSQTVNVTNITYNNSQVYNYGPDYNTLSRYSTRPIQKLTIERETNGDPLAAARSNSLMKVQGDKLMIAAPQQFQRPPKPISPKVVKEKLAQAPVEHGWEPVSDPKAQAELREKMKKEDSKSVPPPTVQASEKAGTSPAATAAPGTTTATVTPLTTGTTTASPAVSANASPSAAPTKDKNKRDDRVSPEPSTSASVNPAAIPEKNKNKQNEKVAPLTTPSASVPAATSPAPTRDKGKNKQRDIVAPSASVPPAPGTTETTAPTVAPKPPKQNKQRDIVAPGASVPPANSTTETTAPTVAPKPPKQNKQRDIVAPSASMPPATGITETTAPTIAPKPPKQKPEKPKNEFAAPPPLDAAPKSAPRVAPPPTPETKQKQPGPDMTKPEAAVERPKPPPLDIPKPKKEQAPVERMLPPPSSANAPGNPPPPRDEGKKKDKNVPVTSPTP